MTTCSKTDRTEPKLKPHAVIPDEQNMRLDRWFKRKFDSVSQGQIQKYLRTGQIRVNGKRVDASYKLQNGDEIRIPPQCYSQAESVRPKTKDEIQKRDRERLKSMVLYQDDDVVVLNKPAGLAVQGGTGLKENLDDLLMALSKDGKTKPKLVHRLDRDTSGVLLVARTDYAARALTASFRDRETKKIYWAITLGDLRPEKGKINAPLIKHGEAMAISKGHEDEKSAITLYEVSEKAKGAAAFVVLWPITGRTHQLRVHMAHKGTPILGDRIYVGDKTCDFPMEEVGKGLHLHARRIIIPHPRRGTIDVSAPLGKEMKKTCRWFGFDADSDISFDDIRHK